MKRRLWFAVLVVVVLAVLTFGRGVWCILTPHRCSKRTNEALAAVKPERFAANGIRHDVYVYRGPRGGPDVILLHELPGLSRDTVRLAERLVDAGYTVHVPLIFGEYGHATLLQALGKCGEFNCLGDGDSRFAAWLRDFMSSKGMAKRGVAVIGMCMTGSAALEVADAPGVRAVVMSQPAMPLPISRWHRPKIGVTDEHAESIKRAGTPILAMRFSKDCMSPPERFETLRKRFDPKKIHLEEIPSGPCRHAHALLTGDFSPAAFGHLERFLNTNLKNAPLPQDAR
ncbi:MAG: dienelactone hydrolase family protein [Acidobacteriota bacterium]